MPKTAEKKSTKTAKSKAKTTKTTKSTKKKKEAVIHPIIKAQTSPKLSEKQKKEQQNKLKPLLAKLNKKYGAGMIKFGSEIVVKELVRVPSSAVPSLDIGIGGGIPRGRVITLSGPFSSCKSAIGYRYIAQAQKEGLQTALVDVEGTYTPEWGAVHGIDNSMLLYIRPETAEEAMDIASELAKDGVDFIMLDSVEALSPKQEMDKDMDEGSRLALRAQLIGIFLRKMNSINNRLTRLGGDGVTLLLINQLREKPMSMGDPEYEPGGRAIGFYASIQMRVRRGDWIRVGSGKNQRIVGQIVKFKVTKNKTYKMLQTGEFDFYTDPTNVLGLPAGSFDTAKQLVIEGCAWGIIESPSQGYYVVNGQKIHGIDNTISALRNDDQLLEYVRQEIMELVKNHTTVDEIEEGEIPANVDPDTGEIFEEEEE